MERTDFHEEDEDRLHFSLSLYSNSSSNSSLESKYERKLVKTIPGKNPRLVPAREKYHPS